MTCGLLLSLDYRVTVGTPGVLRMLHIAGPYSGWLQSLGFD